MNNKNKKIDKNLLHDELVKSLQLTRYAIKDGKPDKDKPVMTTGRDMAFIEKGVTNWKFDLSDVHGMLPSKEKPPLVSVPATWLTSQQALEKGIKVEYGGSANVFGGMGALLVPDGFEIPTVLASTENVKHYGLQLIENKTDFAVTSAKYQLALIQYDYTKDYKKDFLMQKQGGGGIFVETHDFPHIHIPTSENCGGYIVIGKRASAAEFHFTAFQIPYGYALYTPANTIHGDGTLVGVYALALSSSMLATADTVLIYNEHTFEMARGVVPDWKP